MNSTSILLASNLHFSTSSNTRRRHLHLLPGISTSLSFILRARSSFPHFRPCHPKLSSSHSPSSPIPTRRPTSSDFAKSLLTSAIFGVAVSSLSLCSLLVPLPLHASIAPPSVEADQLGKIRKERGGGGRRHEYEDYTDELLETAAVLVRRIEEMRNSGNIDLQSIANALLDVKKERTRISEVLVGMLKEETRISSIEKWELLDRLEIVFQSGLAAVKEQDRLLKLLEIAKNKKKREEEIKKREEEVDIRKMVSKMEEQMDGVEMPDKKIEVSEKEKDDVYIEGEGFRVFEEERNADLEKVNREISDLEAVVMGLEEEKHEGEEVYNVVLDAKITPLKRKIQNLEKTRKKIEEEDVDKLNEKITLLETTINDFSQEYNGIWERIDELDNEDFRKETMLGSIGIKELNFVVRESEILVDKFKDLLEQERLRSQQKDSMGLSKHQIMKDLESAQKKYLEQMILPQVIDVKKESEQVIPNTNSYAFMDNIKQSFKDSKQAQKNLEDRIRKKFKGYGEERSFLIKTPDEEIVKGFPEVELKWMFGQKEVSVPKAHRLRLLHGWKKWREEAKANLKKDLIKNPEQGRQYIAQRQESILTDRDRLVSKTYYNDEKKRWEMNPDAVPYAVSKKLLDHVRIRHDWAAMFLSIKGDDEEYFVDIKLFDLLYEDYGGFDALYVKLMASGIPTAVHFMRIPLAEMDICQQILFIARVSYTFLKELWKTEIVARESQRVFSFIKDTNDDFLVTFVFPVLEFVIPLSIRERIGMAWPEEVDQFLGSTWYLKWQTEAQESYASRQSEGVKWHLWVFIRCIVYSYVLLHIIRFVKRRVPRFLGFGPYRIDPNLIKLGRVKYYFNFKKRKVIRKKKEGFDPIKSAFDGMKRVKNPPIQLDEFASIDSMKEEINEVVEFLQNPTVFMEMGARAPRGVLIVGERGTGKTSLALAIAAKAKVPLVEIKANQLEAGLWVGQSASNVRELFETARDMAPVIIFVEDFDQFAGVRGQFIHTKKQDHEAFINQLLVELDGFEKQEGVVLLATTRNLNQIDQALQRPGRMDRVLHLQRPTQLERERILRMAAEDTMDKNFVEFVDWSKVAEKTALLRPIELKLVPMSLEGTAFRNKFLDVDELMTYCEWFATFSNFIPQWIRRSPPVIMLSEWLVNHLGLTLTREDLESVVDLMEPYGQITNGIELLSPSLDWTREVKFPHAVWAAGRGLIALLLPNFDVVDNIWLEPTSWEGIGCTKITKAKGEASLYGNVETRSYLEKRLVFCFGSYIASQMLLPFGEENFLCSDELKQAQEIATRMVIQYGWGPDDSAAVYFCSNAVSIVSMGNTHELEIAEKVDKMYNLAFDKAEEILMKNRKALENIVEDLIHFENLTGEDLHDIIEKNDGVFQQEPFSLCLPKVISDDEIISDGNGSSSNLTRIIV